MLPAGLREEDSSLSADGVDYADCADFRVYPDFMMVRIAALSIAAPQ